MMSASLTAIRWGSGAHALGYPVPPLRGFLTVPYVRLGLVTFLKLRNHTEILQRRRVTLNVTACRKLAQQTAHDFSTARFRKHVGEANVVGLCKRSDFLRHPLAQFLFQFRSGLAALLEGDERRDCLAFQFVRPANDRSLRHRVVRNE